MSKVTRLREQLGKKKKDFMLNHIFISERATVFERLGAEKDLLEIIELAKKYQIQRDIQVLHGSGWYWTERLVRLLLKPFTN